MRCLIFTCLHLYCCFVITFSRDIWDPINKLNTATNVGAYNKLGSPSCSGPFVFIDARGARFVGVCLIFHTFSCVYSHLRSALLSVLLCEST